MAGYSIKIDRFSEDPVNLAESQFEIVFFAYPPLPPEIGTLVAFQNTPSMDPGERIIDQETCNDEKMSQLDEFYIPRIGDSFSQIREGIRCINDQDLFLQSEEHYINFSRVDIAIYPCDST